jgi:hypothetical protein
LILPHCRKQVLCGNTKSVLSVLTAQIQQWRVRYFVANRRTKTHPSRQGAAHAITSHIEKTASALGEIVVHFKELHGRLGQAELLGDRSNLLL